MSDNQVDTIVIGAGVVGLAIARELTQRKRDVIVIEKEDIFGSITSTRNSGVIHAGIYYDAGTMKAKLCAKGNRALYAYCEKKNIPHLNVGKFVVATSKGEASKLESPTTGLIGLNAPSTGNYAGWDDECFSCFYDGEPVMEPSDCCSSSAISSMSTSTPFICNGTSSVCVG